MDTQLYLSNEALYWIKLFAVLRSTMDVPVRWFLTSLNMALISLGGQLIIIETRVYRADFRISEDSPFLEYPWISFSFSSKHSTKHKWGCEFVKQTLVLEIYKCTCVCIKDLADGQFRLPFYIQIPDNTKRTLQFFDKSSKRRQAGGFEKSKLLGCIMIPMAWLYNEYARLVVQQF